MIVQIDGDNIGDLIELYLLDGKLDAASEVSCRVRIAFDWLRDQLSIIDGASVSLFGGDDIVAVVPDGEAFRKLWPTIQEKVHSTAGITLSAGMGATVQEALESLRRAKLSGRNRLVISGNR